MQTIERILVRVNIKLNRTLLDFVIRYLGLGLSFLIEIWVVIITTIQSLINIYKKCKRKSVYQKEFFTTTSSN